MKRTVVIDVVGLSESLLGPRMPRLNAFRQRGALCRIEPAFPAVTCTAQANYLTGLPPAQHGIVGNGWYDRELAEVHFWKQSNHLVGGTKLWDSLRAEEPQVTCAQLFWWFNMYASVDWSITPRPIYPADGRKVFDIYAWPYSLRTEIKRDLGEFPFSGFWGPAAGLDTPQGPPEMATRWIAESAKWVERKYAPSLSLVYLPHLDYNLQRFGPDGPGIGPDLQRLDGIAGDLVEFFEQRSVQVVLLSEYGISSVDRPIHLNRMFREEGWLTVREELGGELLDCGASRVFAVADHQVAHVYLKDRRLENAVRARLEKEPGIAGVWGAAEKRAWGLDHARAGDLVVVAQDRAWFTYYYWLKDDRAPDFARTVDIHRKPGYDPVELFLDSGRPFMQARIAWRLLRKKMGFRMLMDVISLDASRVKGSHGRRPGDVREWPVLITSRADLAPRDPLESTRVFEVLRKHVLT
jgi:predicted AlkP superfamily pyrophosphatase or phosphodiesterase